MDNMDGFVTKEMAQFFADNPPKAFRPCAYYDKHLDCIRVQIKDCSFTEIRMNKVFTIYEANHTKDGGEFVGFSIKGIRHLFEELELPKAKEGPFILADIINAMIRANLDVFSDLIELIQRKFADMLEAEVEDLPYKKAA